MRNFFIFAVAIFFAFSSVAKAETNAVPPEVKEVFNDICKVYYKSNKDEIYQLPTAEYKAVCECAFGFYILYSKADADLNGIVSMEKRAECNNKNEEFLAQIQKAGKPGVKLDEKYYSDIIKLMSSKEVGRNELYVAGAVSDSKNYILLSGGIKDKLSGQVEGSKLSLFSLKAVMGVLDEVESRQNKKLNQPKMN